MGFIWQFLDTMEQIAQQYNSFEFLLVLLSFLPEMLMMILDPQ